MKSKTLFLVCNAHLDPVWLWEWEEGLAETLSTFRTAAQFCEEYDGFVFCHNESLLYQWVEEHEPMLFTKIQKLVRTGKWHIMGGWYVQPDCNLPAGESFVRQILMAKTYFKSKFKVEPKTAINFDPFGHTQGLVQILKKSGYSSYIFCRPDKGCFAELDDHVKWTEIEDFTWVGFDGSEIIAHHIPDHYNSSHGKAAEKIEDWLNRNNNRETGILLWGIGNHGGGPSRIDIEQIGMLIEKQEEWDIQHATPEKYFAWLEKKKNSLPRLAHDLNPFAVGCYTSMAKVKQKHRQLENLYFATEKMVTQAALQGLITYPRAGLNQALENVLYCEFHDILPGDGISEVETEAVRRLDHGMEILTRLRAKAFFQMIAGYPVAQEGEFPIFVYNPHPYDMEETIVIEFQQIEPNFNWAVFMIPEIFDESGQIVPFQLEKKSCNIQVDQRKRVVFKGKLKAASMNRFSCFLKGSNVGAKQVIPPKEMGLFKCCSDTCEVVINKETGLIDTYKVDGVEILKPQSFKLLVMDDDQDSWGMRVRAFRNLIGEFMLLSPEESAEFSGLAVRKLAPVRIIEDGAIRTTIEALFKFHNSYACVYYNIPKQGNEVEIELRIFWLEKDKMLKLAILSWFDEGRVKGQVAYGVQEYSRFGEELIAQKWIGVSSNDENYAFTVINDRTYGFDFENGELRISLLRSPAYAAHPVDNHIPIVLQDRFEPRQDQGERVFKFWLNAGKISDRFNKVDREALIKNEPPLALCCYPPNQSKKVLQGITVSDEVIQITTIKMAEENEWLIIRLFEPTGKPGTTKITIPYLNMEFEVALNKFEIKSIAIDIQTKTHFEVDLLERKL